MSSIFILTAPSGAGKTTLMSRLREQEPQLVFSISATTREPRHYEENAKDYYFISQEEFEKNIEEDAFIEYEEVYPGTYYGTLKSEIQSILDDGNIPILDIDVNGALNIKDRFGDEVTTVFIKPPSIETLGERLKNRGTEDSESLQKRLSRAEYELQQANRFDYQVVNDDLDRALEELKAIFQEEI